MKVFFRNIHLYLSLAAGLVIAAVCFSGAALVFEKEMQMMIYPERYEVAKGAQRVSIERMTEELQRIVPGAKVASVRIYDDPIRSVELSYTEAKAGAEGRGGPAAGQQGAEARGGAAAPGAAGAPGAAAPRPETKQAFMNPYTGELISLATARSPFFSTMFTLHRWLLAGDVGKLIVGISTLMFLFILMTGIILWWPKTKNILKQRVKLKLNGGWKRINHDMHIVVGFYTAIFLFAFAFTGLAWSFKWFNEGIYWATGTVNKPAPHPHSAVQEGARPISLDLAYQEARKQMPEAEYYVVNRAREADDPIRVTVMPKDAAHERAMEQVYIDQYSGGALGVLHYEDQNLGQRVRSTFYPIHVGSIGGLPGRIVAFISCVAGFTFPITGVILWINRLNKKRRVQRSKVRRILRRKGADQHEEPETAQQVA